MSLALRKIYYYGFTQEENSKLYTDEIELLKSEADAINLVRFPEKRETLAEIHCRIAERYLCLARFSLAKKYLQKAQVMRPDYCDALEQIWEGISLLKEQKYLQATEKLAKANLNFIKLRDKNGISYSTFNLGLCHLGLKNFETALDFLLISNRFLPSKKESKINIAIKSNLASCYFKINFYEKAEKFYFEALEIANKLDLNEFIAVIHFNIGILSKVNKKFFQAQKNFKYSREKFSALNMLKNVTVIDLQLKSFPQQNKD